MMARQVARLSKLVSELLDVSRITTGDLALELETWDIGSLVREAASRLARRFRQIGKRPRDRDRRRLRRAVGSFASIRSSPTCSRTRSSSAAEDRFPPRPGGRSPGCGWWSLTRGSVFPWSTNSVFSAFRARGVRAKLWRVRARLVDREADRRGPRRHHRRRQPARGRIAFTVIFRESVSPGAHAAKRTKSALDELTAVRAHDAGRTRRGWRRTTQGGHVLFYGVELTCGRARLGKNTYVRLELDFLDADEHDFGGRSSRREDGGFSFRGGTIGNGEALFVRRALSRLAIEHDGGELSSPPSRLACSISASTMSGSGAGCPKVRRSVRR